MSRYVIEVCMSRNESIVFAPTNAILRGRWDFANVADRDLSPGLKALARNVRVIPGMCILIDTAESVGSIYDPLSETSDGRVLWTKIERIFKEHAVEFGNGYTVKSAEKTSLSPNQLKDWLWAIAGFVAAGQAVLVPGSDQIPTREEIAKLPGARTRDILNTGPQTGRGIPGEEGLQRFVDVVDVPSGGGRGRGKDAVATTN